MIANTEGGVSSRAADPRIHRLSSRWNPSPTGELEAALERTRRLAGLAAARRRPLGRRARRATRSSNRNTSCCWPSSAARRDPICAQVRPLHPRPAAPGRRLDDLSRRAGRGQRLGQGVLRPQAGGHSPDDPALVQARAGDPRRSAAHARCNSFTRFYLALLGQIPYDDCPTVPPELVLLPSRLNFNL